MVRFLIYLFGFTVLSGFLGLGGILYVFYHFGRGLPDYTQLADYEPPVMTRVHAGDGRLLAEYAVEKRVFVPIEAMPKRVIEAFLSAEDKNFYHHQGVDPLSIVRAVVVNLRNLGSDRRPVGASTITQQVAKNFLLTNEVSIARKIKEAILAIRIERAFDKSRILELYLNEIYLGFGSYGVAAAALNYFNKSLTELSIAEAAFLAALPKAPNNYNPHRHAAAAKARRDWVIGRMAEDGWLDAATAAAAMASGLDLRKRAETEFVTADYFAEEVRKQLVQRFGEKALYQGGLSVRTTMEPRLQQIAERVLRQGLEVYDRRHGWRGPLTTIDVSGPWMAALGAIAEPPGARNWPLAVVLSVDAQGAGIGFKDGTEGQIPLTELKWARAWEKDQTLGPPVRQPSQVLRAGDVVLAEPITSKPGGGVSAEGFFGLRQIPAVEGALIALDPHTGRVLAMVGGYDFAKSQFNRVIQAYRQPGSAFKPFVYLAALEQGYSPATLILDAPFVIDQGPGLPKWRPANYTNKFYGPSTMRLGLEKSRNLMTVRLAQTIGMDKVAGLAERLGVVDKLPQTLAMSLGSGETTLLRLTTAYAMLVNGGKLIEPTLIDRIQDRHGRKVMGHDTRACQGCRAPVWTGQAVPEIPDVRRQMANPQNAYQIVSMLEGVVDRGTGVRIRAVGKPLAGKTGTTNDSIDTWFVGFSPDLAVGVFVAFDGPRSLGASQTGSNVPAPIFRDFMAEALAGKPAIPFRIPPGIRLVRVRAGSGELARPGDRNVILEAFTPETVPTGERQVLRGNSDDLAGGGGGKPAAGTGGLY